MIVDWVLGGVAALLAVAMLAAGGMKIVRHDRVVEEFERYGYSMRFLTVTGVVELLTAGALIGGLFRPTLAVAGGGLALATMVGALYTHYRVDDPLSEAAPAVVLFVLAVVLTAGVAGTSGIVG